MIVKLLKFQISVLVLLLVTYKGASTFRCVILVIFIGKLVV